MFVKMKTVGKNNRGMTLAEIILAIGLIGIIIAGLSPAFLFSTQQIRTSRGNLVATNIGNQTIEEIRNMKFDDVGLLGGNPAGTIEPVRTVVEDNRTFTVNTYIAWVENSGAVGGFIPAWDYKEVRITVISDDPMGGGASVYKEVSTLIARDASQPLLTGSHLRVSVFRGWGRTETESVPQPNVKAGINGNSTWLYSGSKGTALFVGLPQGTYTVDVDPSALGMILNPKEEEAYPRTDVELLEFQTTQLFAEVEYPVSLRVGFRSAATGEALVLGSLGATASITLDQPYADDLVYVFSSTDATGLLPADAFTGLWPVGEGGYAGAYAINDINIPGYTVSVNLTQQSPWDPQTGTRWDGGFTAPGTEKTVYIYLWRNSDVISGYSAAVAAMPDNNDDSAYTAESWTAFSDAIAECELGLTAADGMEALVAETASIQAALALLVPESTGADSSFYNAAVASIPVDNSAGIYTAESWTAFADAIAECDLGMDASAGQEALDAETQKILIALDLLETV